MKTLTFFSVLLFTVFTQAQDKRGYYITAGGQRIEGLFKEANFLKVENPKFTTLPGGEYIELQPESVKEYGIEDDYKFESHTVKVDLSQSVSFSGYSTVKEPRWEKRTIFLSVITEGDATLYSAYIGEEMKYFYSVKSKSILPEQLVYKKYYNGHVVKENIDFRQELFNNVNCNKDIQSYNSIAYAAKSLTKVVNDYNTCNGGTTSKSYDNKSQKQESLKFTVGAGVNLNRFIFDAGNTDKDSQVGLSIAAEAVFVMPYSRFGFFARLDYTKAKGEAMVKDEHSDYVMRGGVLDGNFIGLVLGPRFYFSELKADKGLFLDAGIGIGYGSGSVTRATYSITNGGLTGGTTAEYDLSSNIFIGAGLGYNINKRFGVDVRYETNREVVNQQGDFKYGKTGVNVRYTFN